MSLKSLAKNSYVIKYKNLFKKFELELSCTKLIWSNLWDKIAKTKTFKVVDFFLPETKFNKKHM